MSKRKFKDELETETTSCCEDPSTCQAKPDCCSLVTAAKALVAKYAETHTITDLDSYRYPGLKDLVIALNEIK